MSTLILYDYWRSSAAYRVRIALKLKGLTYESRPVNLAEGEQLKEPYASINPHSAVPMLLDGNVKLTQSLAIIEYLDERHPNPPLLPTTPEHRAQARAIAQHIACDIHPLNTPRILKYITGPLKQTEEAKLDWYKHWVQKGLQALEAMVKETSQGKYCVGENPTLADICLIPQMYNARRFNCPLDDFPTLKTIESHCNSLISFQAAKPETQTDAQSS